MADRFVVNHVGHCVTDIDRAIRFYRDLLGFEVAWELNVPDEATGPLLDIEAPVGLRAMYLRSGSFVLELLRFDRPDNPESAVRVFNEPGLTHLSMCVDDPAAVVAQVEQYGGSISRSMLPMAAIIRDPDGQLLELLPMSYRDRVPPIPS
jgi:catechol 2,3-dioxygenase-like lactoylglutathione lyase family enzyme